MYVHLIISKKKPIGMQIHNKQTVFTVIIQV